MAAATITIRRPSFARMRHGGEPLIMSFKADTAATWSANQIVAYNTATGKVSGAIGAAATAMLGLALSPCPYVTRTDLTEYPVLVFTEETLIAINVWANNTATVANVITQVMLMEGTGYNVAVSASTQAVGQVLNVGSQAQPVFLINEVTGNTKDDGIIGDLYQRVVVSILLAARQWK